jgi:hypothetical protein
MFSSQDTNVWCSKNVNNPHSLPTNYCVFIVYSENCWYTSVPMHICYPPTSIHVSHMFLYLLLQLEKLMFMSYDNWLSVIVTEVPSTAFLSLTIIFNCSELYRKHKKSHPYTLLHGHLPLCNIYLQTQIGSMHMTNSHKLDIYITGTSKGWANCVQLTEHTISC